MKKLKIDLQLLNAVLAESDSVEVSTYIDTETGDVFSEKDMLMEEVENCKRFLQVPSSRIWSISREAIEKWVADILQIVAENYDPNFLPKVKAKLEQAIKQVDYMESVCAALSELQGKGLDDNYFSNWLHFLEQEEINNVKTWLASQGIALIY